MLTDDAIGERYEIFKESEELAKRIRRNQPIPRDSIILFDFSFAR